MFRLRRPSPESVERLLAARAEADFSYPDPGLTRSGGRALPPSLRNRYDIDSLRVRLGAGPEHFDDARRALLAWVPLELAWLQTFGTDEPVAPGSVVASLTRVAGLWALNPCRVVYVLDEPGLAAWAYGTLPGHAEIGEERFGVVHDPESDEVHYEVLAVSRPGSWGVQLGYPVARRLQQRFRLDSALAMQRAVGAEDD